MSILESLQDADKRGVSPPQNWTTEAVNEIKALRAELAAERELNILRANQYSVMRVSAEVLAARCDTQNQQLAILTLDNQRLREALEEVLRVARLPTDPKYSHVLCTTEICRIVTDELSTPTDTAALDAYVAEKVEPWKKDALIARSRKVSGWLRGFEFIPLPELARKTDTPLFTLSEPAAIAAQEKNND